MAVTVTPLFCALDMTDLGRARSLAETLSSLGLGLKLGLEFYSSHGPKGVREIRKAAPLAPIFLDLKFHDIPNTVAGALRGVADLEVAYVNVHAAGGRAMLEAAVETLRGTPARLLGVTVLTSLDDTGLNEIGLEHSAEDYVTRWARLCAEAGLAGVVCAASDIRRVREACGSEAILMVPGIRPGGRAVRDEDQKRVWTPSAAMQAGATHLVVGRPITQADDPRSAAKAILEEINTGRASA